MLLVVPNLLVFLQLALVQLVELREGSWPVHFLSLLLLLLLGFLLPKLDMRRMMWFFLFGVVVGSDIDAIGIQFGRLKILRLKTSLAEKPMQLISRGKEVKSVVFDFAEAGEQIYLSKFGHRDL